ncbi:dephospho-CoA kinase [Ferrovibrio sp.]|uniref:dephospho-CoA kinase n=1 Tax=Ferrovibrio sp. TaxID=1917215 RepID=UPI0025C4B8DC|nr:dephospho-CoA kinase [Ferrovibrio sp.]MBX3453480.1 dephospho-CoA kinase [Ferrovibrio sp.]
MIKLALTGSIGMGKSTVAAMFTSLGVPVFDADAAVHELYAPGGAAVAPMLAAFPDAHTPAGGIDRAVLVRHMLADAAALKRIEAIVHPLVGEMRQRFLQDAEGRGEAVVLLDIPLLFEGRGRDGVDHVAVVSAPADMQRARVLARPGMTEEKFAAILAKQVPDAEKRRLADTVIDTGLPVAETEKQVAALVHRLRKEATHHA